MAITETILGREPFGILEKRDVIWTVDSDPTSPVRLTVVYAPDGGYVGDECTASQLLTRGIVPEKRTPEATVCSIGFSAQEQRWYGWSHRAICGFGIGDVVKEGDCVSSSGWDPAYLALHPEADVSLPVGFVAQTLDDAKRLAIAFADSVS